jgi:hypothetical protein
MERTLRSRGREVSLQKWTGGIDWFRWVTTEFNDTAELQRALHAIQERDRARASNLRRWSFQGYRGWQTDSVRWGQRNGRVLWESSGSRAADMMGLSDACAGYTSRIDTHCTLTLSTPLPSFGTCLLGSTSPTSRSRSSLSTLVGHRGSTIGLWLGTVGRRTAPSYIRVYDKGVESRCAAPGVLWRIELEAKHQHARKLWELNRGKLKSPAFCASYSVQSLTSQGFSWPFGPLDDESHDVTAGPRPKSTVQSLAAWLVLSVRPVISRMLTVFTVGELLQMLGLSDVAAPTGNNNA